MNCSRTFATVLMHTYYKSTYCAYIRFTLVIESHIISKQHVILILPHDAKLHFIYKNKNIAHIWRFQCISLFNECTVRQLSPGQSHWTSPSMSYAPYFMSKFQSHNTTIAVEKLKLQYCFFAMLEFEETNVQIPIKKYTLFQTTRRINQSTNHIF